MDCEETVVAIVGMDKFFGSKIMKYSSSRTKIISLPRLYPHHKKTVSYPLFLLRGVDVVVFLVRGEAILDDLQAISSYCEECKKVGIRRFILISSLGVYDPQFRGMLDERSPYLTQGDPLKTTMRQLEHKVIQQATQDFRVLVLQPTIVYGNGGKTTAKILDRVSQFETLRLPQTGNSFCHVVHIKDLCQAVEKAALQREKALFGESFYQRIIIGSSEPETWSCFYTAHCQILGKVIKIQNLGTHHTLHSSKAMNWALSRLYSAAWVQFLYHAQLKQKFLARRKKRADILPKYEDLIDRKQQGLWEPKLFERFDHNCNFVIDTRKAKQLLGYQPAMQLSSQAILDT
jgi:hypothetical protein